MAKKTAQTEKKTVLEVITNTLDDMKAEDVVVIDLEGKTSIAGYMVVASGTSNRHVASIAQKIEENLKAAKYRCSVEGESKADWVLIDAFDVIVHIFRPEVREFYNLEKMWQSAANLRKE
ncbi:MAG: ribosome silencing factor [Alphaproteobacteria bacterium]|nr:ribosome silencing factor [Alphaproteobacteria bacterium]